MGLVRMGPPEELVLLLRDRRGVRCFVETGTFQGNTTAWAARHFERVMTIEGAEPLYRAAKARLAEFPNVECRLGDSRGQLAELAPTLTEPVLFWLDAHWCGEQTFGKEDECPLLDEIAILDRTGIEHLLLIDDARLFLSPPPKPHRRENWPSLDQVLDALRASFKSYVVVFEDVLIRAPESARSLVGEFCQNASTQAQQTWVADIQRRERLESKRLYRLARRVAARMFG